MRSLAEIHCDLSKVKGQIESLERFLDKARARRRKLHVEYLKANAADVPGRDEAAKED